jgi:hypothetical protein
VLRQHISRRFLGLPSVREILTSLKQKEVINLTADDDDGDEKDVIEVSWLRDRLNTL